MSNPSSATVSNGQARTGRTVDWNGYPALFQRVAPTSHPHETVETPAGGAPIIGQTGGIREAFLGFCQAALFTPEFSHRFERPSESVAAAKAIAAGEAFGFTREELRQLGCGLYPGPAAVRSDLRSVGFRDAEIDGTRIVGDDSGRPRAELAGCLLVPLTDEVGQLCDFLLLTVAEQGNGFSGYRFLYGPAKTDVVVYGLQSALSRQFSRESLILVDDVLEALLLQCRGLPHVASLGASGSDLTPRRWEELARLGVSTVTLAFRRDERHSSEVRDCLVNALRAKTAPQVFVANPYPGGERCPVDVLRRFGKDACATALSSRLLAFHDKDFGAADRFRATPEPAQTVTAPQPEPTPVRPRPEPAIAPGEPHYRDAFRRHLAELAAALPAEDRRFAEQVIAAVDTAIAAGDWRRAYWHAGAASSEWATPYAAWPGTFGWAGYGPPAWGYEPTWSFEPAWLSRQAEPQPVPASSIASASDVLDRLIQSPQRAEIPAHLAGFAGRETPSAVEWVVDSSARDRLATLCERIVDACERRPDQSFVVVCREHTEQQIMLALATHLAARLSDGSGLTIEEVRSRFAGSEPATGYRDKPWLADEAADRLRLWSSRLTFVTGSQATTDCNAVERAIDATRTTSSFGGVYFDSLPNTGWHGATDPSLLAWLNDLAMRCGGQVFATAATAPVVLSTPHPMAAWPIPAHAVPNWPRYGGPSPTARLSQTDGGRCVLATLGDWLRRECDARPAAA